MRFGKEITSYESYIAELPIDVEGKKVRSITFQVTDNCNLACTYCYQHNKGCHRLSLSTAQKFIDMLFEDEAIGDYLDRKDTRAVSLDFIGGEPLLEVELIDQILDYFIWKAFELDHKWLKCFKACITTNGILFNTNKVQKFMKKHKDHLSLTITIDGNKELHDACRVFPDGSPTYDIVEDSVKNAIKNYGMKTTKLTLAPGNISELSNAVKNLYALGFPAVYANTIFEKGWTVEHAKIFYEQLKILADHIIESEQDQEVYCSLFDNRFFRPMKEDENDNWCGGTGNMISIDYKGDIYPCIRYMESSLGNNVPPMIIGNVDTGMMSTRAQRDCVSCLKCITRKSQSTEECYNCPIASGCAWCSGYNYEMTGTANKRVTYICIMHKARSLANTYFWNKYYLKNGIKNYFKNYVPLEWALEIIDPNELNLLNDLERRAYHEASIC